jgi:hypothetical protein
MAIRELSAAAALDLWQAADGLDPVERPVALAAAAGDRPAEELARLPLGRRDAQLVALHAALAGPVLEMTAVCPACGEQAEAAVDTVALLEHGGEDVAPIEVDGVVIEWRPPDSLDLAAAAAAPDAAAAEAVLLSRCVSPAALGPEAREAVAGAMAQADPLAEVLVEVSCPACGEAFVADLDVGDFVWAEVRARAGHLLREVDVLARAYGWNEDEVLALDDRRRAAYLELAREAAR